MKDVKHVSFLAVFSIVLFFGCSLENTKVEDSVKVEMVGTIADSVPVSSELLFKLDLGDDNSVSWIGDGNGGVSIFIVCDDAEQSKQIKSMTYSEIFSTYADGEVPAVLIAALKNECNADQSLSSGSGESGPDYTWGICDPWDTLHLKDDFGYTPIMRYRSDPNVWFRITISFSALKKKDIAYRLYPVGPGGAYMKTYFIGSNGNAIYVDEYIVPQGKVGEFNFGHPLGYNYLYLKIFFCSEDNHNGYLNNNVQTNWSMFVKNF